MNAPIQIAISGWWVAIRKLEGWAFSPSLQPGTILIWKFVWAHEPCSNFIVQEADISLYQLLPHMTNNIMFLKHFSLSKLLNFILCIKPYPLKFIFLHMSLRGLLFYKMKCISDIRYQVGVRYSRLVGVHFIDLLCRMVGLNDGGAINLPTWYLTQQCTTLLQ